MARIKVKRISIKVHPNFYNKLEKMRKDAFNKNGITVSQTDLTNLIAKSYSFSDVMGWPKDGNKSKKYKRGRK